jgi:hypothetical protein
VEDQMSRERGDFDLGSGFSYSFFSWKPERDLNPQYDGIPDVEKAGITIWKDGELVGSCHFDTPEVRRVPGLHSGHWWKLLSLDPLHIEPSIQMYDQKTRKPSHHGFIRGGKWVQA